MEAVARAVACDMLYGWALAEVRLLPIPNLFQCFTIRAHLQGRRILARAIGKSSTMRKQGGLAACAAARASSLWKLMSLPEVPTHRMPLGQPEQAMQTSLHFSCTCRQSSSASDGHVTVLFS